MILIKVSGDSRTSAVAGAIAGVVREQRSAEIQTVGAGALNQAVKGLILAVGYLREDGIHVCFVPEFVDVTIDGMAKTAIKLVVEPIQGSDTLPPKSLEVHLPSKLTEQVSLENPLT